MATSNFPPDLDQFIRREIDAGKCQNEDELDLEAVRLPRHREEFREALKQRMERRDQGEEIVLEDDRALMDFG